MCGGFPLVGLSRAGGAAKAACAARREGGALRAPPLRAVMERRILVNFRADPHVLAKAVPPPFRPALVQGYGVAGICLIRLACIRSAPFPAGVGLTSENAAHRVAVERDTPDGPAAGVYVPRR